MLDTTPIWSLFRQFASLATRRARDRVQRITIDGWPWPLQFPAASQLVPVRGSPLRTHLCFRITFSGCSSEQFSNWPLGILPLKQDHLLTFVPSSTGYPSVQGPSMTRVYTTRTPPCRLPCPAYSMSPPPYAASITAPSPKRTTDSSGVSTDSSPESPNLPISAS